MEGLLRALLQLGEIAEAAEELARGRSPVLMTGLGPVHRAQTAAAITAHM